MDSFMPRQLYLQGKSTRYPLDRRLGVPQIRSGHDGEEKNSQPPPGIEPQNPDFQPVAQSLYQLGYHGSYFIRLCGVLLKYVKLKSIR
jgi:hypothetical protein